jgi:hypothetical protein
MADLHVMKSVKRILLAALLSVASGPTRAQDQSPLDFEIS